MSEIFINLNNEDADITNADLISSGDVDTVEVHFSFSEEWNEFPVKTMCVHAITQDEENKIGTNFIGITSEGLSVVPQGALAKAGRLFIAVVGENPNGKILTSTWVTLKIRRGADFLVKDDDVDVLGRLMPAGGNEGDILVKNSDENFDYAWKPSSESLEAGLNISIVDQVISSNCFREVEELPEIGVAGVIYILDNTESPDVEGVFTWDASAEQYISFGKSYTAGDNITISEQGVISATDTTYTAGDNIQISNENVITATDTTYTAGQNIQINSNNEISATDTTYSAGNGLDLDANNVFKADNVIVCDTLPLISDAVERNIYAMTYIKDAKWLPKTGLPNRYQTQEAYDAWLDDGHTATIFKTSYGAENAADCILVEDLPPFEIIDNEVYSVNKSDDLSGLQMYAIAWNLGQTDVVWTDIGTTSSPLINGLIISAEDKISSATQESGTYVATFDPAYGEYSGIVYSDQLAYQGENLFYSLANNQWALYDERSSEPKTYVKLYIFDGEKYIYVTDSNLTGHVTSSDIDLDEFKKFVAETYALKKYYGDENINLGNVNGVPSNTYATGSIWNQATGTSNTINGQYNEVFGNNNNINGGYNNITGYGLYINGQFNVAFGPIMPEAKKLQGMCNIVTAYGNDVSGNENAVFGNNNKVRGDAHLIAGHGHDVQGYNNLVTGEYSTVTGTDNAVFGINYGTIQGNSNIVNGYYTYIKENSNHNIVSGSYHTVTGGNNLVAGEQTSNDSFTFPDDEEATTFDHINGYDNIYSGFMGSITGRHNILTASYGKILGDQNLVMGEHYAVKGGNNILTGSGGDGGFVGSNNIAVLGGYGTVINNVEYSNILSGYTTAENLRYAALNTFYSRFQNAQYINANGYGLKFSGTLDENDYYTNPIGLTIIGQWNEDGNDRNDYVFVVGGGTGDDINRKNVFTITKNGQVTCTINNKKHTVFGSSCVTDTLPQTGQEDTLYVLTSSTQSFTLNGELPDEFKTQSAYETWNGGGKAMMLCVDTNATAYATQFGIKYILLEGIVVEPFAQTSGGQDIYYKVTQVGSTPVQYTYSTVSNQWTASPITGVSVGDYLYAVGSATGITPRDTDIVIDDLNGSISSDIGLEWMSGNATSNQWNIEYSPSQYITHTYTYADNVYEIYTGNSHDSASGLYIYKNNAYIQIATGGGGGSSYVAGDNIDITGNVISADIIEPIATFTLTPTGTTPAYTVSCDTTYSELISRYNSDKLKTQLIVEGNNGETVLNMDRFEYRSGVAKFYFEYTEEDYLYVYEITKTGNPSADTYSYNKISTRVQKKLTPGTNITIDNTDPDNPVINATGGGGGTTYTAGVGIDIDSNNAINTVRIKVAHLDVTGTPSINYTWTEINNLLGSYTAYGSATCYLWYGHTGAVFDTAIGSYEISNNGIFIHFTCIYGNTIEYRSYYLSSENVFTMTQRTVTDYQKKLTAGTGISIDPTTNTISLDLPQAEGGGF